MSWLRNLFGHTHKDVTHNRPFPIHMELVPGILKAHIYLHEIDTQYGPLLCWSYVTEGLIADKQRELIFTLRCNPQEPPEAFPPDPLHFFVTVHELAQQGRLVNAYGVTQFRSGNLFGRHLIYMVPQAFPDVVMPASAIAAILVTEDEIIAAQEFGVTRVMSRLGFASRYYPFPPWSDRLRSGISFAQVREQTVLAGTARIFAYGIRILQEGQRLFLYVNPQASERLQTGLAEAQGNLPLALLTSLDHTANACLFWEPGQSGLAAIRPPGSDGSRIAGCFVLFVPEQEEDCLLRIEDGFALRLMNSTWDTIRQSLIQAKPLTLLIAKQEISVSLEWMAA